MEILTNFDLIRINPECINSDIAKRFQDKFPLANFIELATNAENQISNPLSSEEFIQSKRSILISNKKGPFISRCPGFSPQLATLCCSFHVIDLGHGCNYNCSYCFLQTRLKQRDIEIYSNINTLIDELSVLAETSINSEIVFGCGESFDPLSLDPVTLNSHTLFPFFQKHPNWTLEIKTKSSNVDQFINLEASKNILFQWTLNPQSVIDSEEQDTASLVDRIEAASKCLRAGYSVGFLFFPVIYSTNWKLEYETLIDLVISRFENDADKIAISVGPLLLDNMGDKYLQSRFPNSKIDQTLLSQLENGSLKYEPKLRREMLNFILNKFRNSKKQWRLHACPPRIFS